MLAWETSYAFLNMTNGVFLKAIFIVQLRLILYAKFSSLLKYSVQAIFVRIMG